MTHLVDNRYDPPRISPWWVVLLVAVDVVALAIAVAAALDGRWFTAAYFAFFAVFATYQQARLRQRHRRALADWRPPPRPPSA